MKNTSKWIWYYGDFELYHSLRMQTRREEFDYRFPPFWRLDDCYHNVRFRKTVTLETAEKVKIHAYGTGMAEFDGKRFAFGTEYLVDAGEHTIMIYISNPDGLPCVFVEGGAVKSDETWEASCYGNEWVSAGCNDFYASPEDNPQIFKFSYTEIAPVNIEEINGGTLYDFGRETFAKIVFDTAKEFKIYYGESREEALDTENSILRDTVTTEHTELPCRAFRYIFITGSDKAEFKTYYEYLPLEMRGRFKCSDELINKIWDTSVYTFHLNSREFFLDGIKRDRWVWSGDAYQSYLINRYSFFDADIVKRTIIALRGKEPTDKHINTILDYSFYWIMSIYDCYEMTGDIEFVRNIYPKMESLMEFCLSRLDENGFAAGVEGDWVFIDWADMDKTGAVCAEQMLLLKSLEAISACAELIGRDSAEYTKKAEELKIKINEFFWNEEKGAYIDNFESGRNNVTRHANIFAILFDYANEKQQKSIIKNVLLNDNVEQIKTPYFKFYELEALCKIGELNVVLDRMRKYWGGMLREGATTFWEEYTPELSGREQYGMYGDKFGKSLCHAWGASPVYLIGRYFLGVRPTSPGYASFDVNPRLEMFDEIEAEVPVNGGTVHIEKKDGKVTIRRNLHR